MGAALSKTQETEILGKKACEGRHTLFPAKEAKLEIEAKVSWIH